MKNLLTVAFAAAMLLSCKQNQNMNTLSLTSEWDKTFPLSELVYHKKVTFDNQFGLTLAADLYVPRSFADAQDDKGFPAIAVSGPFGAVKEQSSGLYAMRMAERGFVTLAFDKIETFFNTYLK